MNEEVKSIVDTLSQQGRMVFLECATEEQIDEFERQNNLTLPDQYHQWLQFSDGGEFFLPAGVQLYGIAHKPLIDVDDDDRPDKQYIVIGALATGDPVLCKMGTENIAIYNHDAGRIEDDEVYEDFFSFLKDLYDLLGIGG